tara:strand:+ start:5233 stop:5385 length:153 start_codon:yes stop_codon:yes gene_type:complete
MSKPTPGTPDRQEKESTAGRLKAAASKAIENSGLEDSVIQLLKKVLGKVG